MRIGTKSVLFGAHCFFIHPWFVARAWTRLYGFPLDLRLWAAFFLHDIGYIGKPNMDGAEGETHVELGAKVMHFLFDRPTTYENRDGLYFWHDFCLYHSRYYAKRAGKPVSRLCYADKLAFAVTPKWLYLPMVKITGELEEYMNDTKYGDDRANWTPSQWFDRVSQWVTNWTKENAYAEKI